MFYKACRGWGLIIFALTLNMLMDSRLHIYGSEILPTHLRGSL